MSIRKAFNCVESDVLEVSENATSEIATTVEMRNEAIPTTASIVSDLEHGDTALGKVDFEIVTQSVEEGLSCNTTNSLTLIGIKLENMRVKMGRLER